MLSPPCSFNCPWDSMVLINTEIISLFQLINMYIDHRICAGVISKQYGTQYTQEMFLKSVIVMEFLSRRTCTKLIIIIGTSEKVKGKKE